MTGPPLFIVNARSHAVSTRGSVLERVAADLGEIPVVQFTDVDQLTADLSEQLAAGRGTLFIEGGDGTVDAVLTVCLNRAAPEASPAKLAILPGGSTNLAYKVLGLEGADRASVKKHVAGLASGAEPLRTRRHKALMVKTAAAPAPQAGFLLSTGSLSRAMLYTQQNLHDVRRGSVSVARAVLQLGVFPEGTLDSDGAPVIRPSPFVELTDTTCAPSADHAFALMSTFETLSLGMRPFWNRGGHAIGFTHGAWPIRNLRSGVAKLVMGRPGEALEPHGLTSRGCDEISFTCDGPVVLDGEVLPQPADGRFDVSVSPDVEFIR